MISTQKSLRRGRTIGLLAAGATALAAVAMPAIAGKDDNTLNVAFTAEPEPLDGYKIAGREGLIVARHVYDGLLYKDLDTGEITGALATSYEFIDPMTLEFELREGVTFHDGTPFSADDVLDTLNTVIAEAYGTRYSISVDWIESVEKIDDMKVRIHMTKPFAGALEMLADALPIYPSEQFNEGGSEAMVRNPVGTGPYRLVSQDPGIRYELELFEDHYEGSPKSGATIERIVIRTIPELNTQFAELMSGSLDWIWRVPPDQADQLASHVNVVNAPIMRIGYISLAPKANSGDTPVADKRVRQAMIHAIDREGIVAAFAGGASRVLDSACNPAQFGCEQDVKSYEHDPEKARALLAEAGYADGFSIEMVFASMPRPMAEAVAADLGKVGINVQLNEQQYSSGAGQWRTGELPAFFTNWGSYGVGDVVFLLSNFFAGEGDDMVGDEEVSQWVITADTSPDRDERIENYSKALKKIAEEAYWIPMYNFSINYAMSPDLVFTPHPDEFARFWQSSWK